VPELHGLLGLHSPILDAQLQQLPHNPRKGESKMGKPLKQLTDTQRLNRLGKIAERVEKDGWDAATLRQFDETHCVRISCGTCPMDRLCPPRGTDPKKTIDEEVKDTK